MKLLHSNPLALDKRAPANTPATPSIACEEITPSSLRHVFKSATNYNIFNTLTIKNMEGVGAGTSTIRILTVLLIAAISYSPIHAQTQSPPPQTERPIDLKHSKKEKNSSENIEWLWQYTPDADHKDGRENDLAQDLRFRPFLEQFLIAPQTFWGTPIDGHPRSLATTALDHLTVPDKVVADENRYVSISGCVVHFCPARGLLWIDLNGTHHLVVFAALDWIKEGRPTSDPAAEYTLWIFPNEPLSIATGSGPVQHPPAALTKAIARWAAEPLPGNGIVQNITHAILVDPDGTPHSVEPSALGVGTTSEKSEPEAAPLKSRN
jgi:hypothetical protein